LLPPLQQPTLLSWQKVLLMQLIHKFPTLQAAVNAWHLLTLILHLTAISWVMLLQVLLVISTVPFLHGLRLKFLATPSKVMLAVQLPPLKNQLLPLLLSAPRLLSHTTPPVNSTTISFSPPTTSSSLLSPSAHITPPTVLMLV